MKITALVRLEGYGRRLREVVRVLSKYGLAGWLESVDQDWLRDALLRSPDDRKLAQAGNEARVRLALTELGPTFIKVGQILSTRPDVVGFDLARELSRLQADTPADPPEVVGRIVEEDLGRTPEEVFEAFEEEAIASASIGQVHRARLPGGGKVVVKVQHDGIRETVERDLDILQGLAELAQRHVPQLRSFQPVAMAREFRKTLLRELDYTRERRHLEQFARNFADDDTVHIPGVFPEFCGRRVLTMEMLEGTRLSEPDAVAKAGADGAELARRGANLYLEMIFRDGFYHADPHPGNLVILPHDVIGLLDFGMVGRIDDDLREEVEALVLAAAAGDAESIADAVIRLGSVPRDLDRSALKAEVGDFVEDLIGGSLADFDMSGALAGLTEIIRRHHILLPGPVSLLLKTLVMLEGTARDLHPDFSLSELIQPYYYKAMRRRLSPRRLLRRAQRSYRDWERLVEVFPREMADILERVRQGTFDVHLDHRGLEPAVNRLVVGILTAALLMASAELWSRQVPPLVGGISLFGAAGYALAAFLGFRLFVAIRKSGDIRRKDGK